MFNLNETKGSIGKQLSAGIKNAKFMGVEKGVLERKDGTGSMNIMIVTFNIEGFGDYKWNLFEPTDNKRKSNQFGGENPSQVEQFIISCRHLIDVCNPEVGEAIERGDSTLHANSFKEFVDKMKEATSPYIGKSLQVKLLPNGDYVNIPSYPCSINREGGTYLSTRFLGTSLTLTPKELERINNINNAKPTPMVSSDDDLDGDISNDSNKGSEVSSMASALDDDDLPF